MNANMELPENADETAVQDFLQILDEHRKNCEAEGKYIEAEIAKNRLEELRNHEENRRREEMRSRHIAERLGVEEAHMIEFQQFTAMWDAKIQKFEMHARELEDAMKERHSLELKDFHEQWFSEPAHRIKFSKELLNLRKIQETLARQKEYSEAQKVKQKADNLEAWEREKMKMEQIQRGQVREQKLLDNHEGELGALRKRIQTTREELKRKRQTELERLLQRFQNVKAELENQQQKERLLTEKFSVSYRAFTQGPALRASAANNARSAAAATRGPKKSKKKASAASSS